MPASGRGVRSREIKGRALNEVSPMQIVGLLFPSSHDLQISAFLHPRLLTLAKVVMSQRPQVAC